MTVASLAHDIRVYEGMRAQLEEDHLGEWAVVYDEELIGTYADLDEAAAVAVQRFGGGPYLIRQVGQRRERLPASVLYRVVE